jgi:hypothetical protein
MSMAAVTLSFGNQAVTCVMKIGIGPLGEMASVLILSQPRGLG